MRKGKQPLTVPLAKPLSLSLKHSIRDLLEKFERADQELLNCYELFSMHMHIGKNA